MQRFAAISAALLAGCTAPKSEWKPVGYYVTNQSVFGCDSFEGKKGTSAKRTAALSLKLQRQLLALLGQAASQDEKLQKDLDDYRNHLACWYETPEAGIQLSLGELCDGPLQIEFRERSGEWSLTSGERAIVECPPPSTSLERTRDR
jgi:hypothetical protein